MVDEFSRIKKWDLRFIEIAKQISLWSKDPSKKVGAVIVGKNKQIISQGYNGFPRNFPDTDQLLSNRTEKYKYIIHAELNAIFNALYNGSSVVGATIYVHGLPVCNECAKAIAQSGIKRVVIDSKPNERWKESSEIAMKIFDECGIQVIFYDENDD